jgi:hypothetical protein
MALLEGINAAHDLLDRVHPGLGLAWKIVLSVTKLIQPASSASCRAGIGLI